MKDSIPAPALLQRSRRAGGQDFASRLETARAHFLAGRLQKAEMLVRQCLRKHDCDARALHLMGLIARRKGRLERAIQLLAKAVVAAPDDAAMLCDLGLAYRAAGRFENALACQEKVVGLLPGSAEALSNLGAAYRSAGRLTEALDWLGRAVGLQPGTAELHYNLANGLLAAGRPRDAETSFGRTIALAPDHEAAHVNRAVAFKEQGRLDEAIGALRAAVARMPGNADAHWNLALALLMAGHYGEGWAEYEWRRRIPGFAMAQLQGLPSDGGALDGRTLLIHAEQGLGDTIQFCRYIPSLAGRDGSVVFMCQQPLKPLLQGLDGKFRLVGSEEKLPPFDVHAPLLSLPHLLGALAPRPESGAYLRPEDGRARRWAGWLAIGTATGTGLKVGICWQGRPGFKADRQRSLPLEHFAPLATMPGVRLVSLQMGEGAEQMGAQPWRDAIRDPGPELDRDGAFLDTAAIIANLDLVITSDTAMAHLAGALGAPTWLLLAHVPDWRWGIEGTATPWYARTRLFRQQRPGDWGDVMQRVCDQLEGFGK